MDNTQKLFYLNYDISSMNIILDNQSIDVKNIQDNITKLQDNITLLMDHFSTNNTISQCIIELTAIVNSS